MTVSSETRATPANLLVDRTEYGARITLNRPEVSNAADLHLWERIGSEVARLAKDPSVRVIVVTGAGNRAFMAGAEIGEFPAVLRDPAKIRQYLNTVTDSLNLIEDIPIPVIAEVNGAAIGGGLELAVACDYRVTVETAKFGIPSANFGLAIAYPDIERLVSLVGSGRARDLLIFGKIYTAPEALSIGLVNEIVPREALSVRVHELATDLAGKAALSIGSAKKVLKSIVHGGQNPSNVFLEAALQSIWDAWDSDDFKQRVDQMVNRRT